MIRVSFFVFYFLPFILFAQTAFISGNDTICQNDQSIAEISVSFSGISPYTFSFAIDGVVQPTVITSINPYIINTNIAGNYTLLSYNDANSFGMVSGSALVTVLESPLAIIHLQSDTLSIVHPVANFMSKSIGDIISWSWNFGDNTINNTSSNVSHIYNDSSAVYNVSLIVEDINGCLDTAIQNIWIRDEFWIYIPDSFTPDNNLKNDKFCIEYNGIRESTFLFKIFNLQGSLVFQTTNISELTCSLGEGWGGGFLSQDIDLLPEIYTYQVYFQDFEGWKHQKYGMINLIR